MPVLPITKLIFLPLAMALLSLPVMARALYDFLNGGSSWRQGDWLINTGEGFVRRGLFGDIFIALSDLTGLNLLLLVQIFQVSLFVALTFVIWLLCVRTPHLRIVALLAASPGFFLIFWAGDVQGTMRKELFVLLAMALLALGSQMRHPAPILPAFAVVLFTLGCIGNIMTAFMAPALLAGFYLLWLTGKMSRAGLGFYTGATVAMAVLWLGISLVFKETPALAGMCAPLVARGLDPIFCDGAMFWVVSGNIDHMTELVTKVTWPNLGIYAVVATLTILPVLLSFRVFAERQLLMMLALLCFLPMLPLYAVATDWGRWISISYTAYAFLVFQALTQGQLTVVNPPRNQVLFGLLAIALLLTPEHGIDWQPGGALRSILITFNELF